MLYIVRNTQNGKRAASMCLMSEDRRTGKKKERPLAIHVFLSFKEANDLKKRLNRFEPKKPWVVRPVELTETI